MDNLGYYLLLSHFDKWRRMLGKWVYIIALPASVPIFVRIIVIVLALDPNGKPMFTSGDLILFGLSLSISNIAIVESRHILEESWLIARNSLSVALIGVAVLLYGMCCLLDLGAKVIDERVLFWFSVGMAIASVMLSLSVWYQLYRASKSDAANKSRGT